MNGSHIITIIAVAVFAIILISIIVSIRKKLSRVAVKKVKVAIEPGNADKHYQLGLGYLRQKLYSDAIDEVTNALRCDNKYVKAYRSRGATFYKTEMYEDALKDFDKAILLDARDEKTYLQKTDVHLKMSDIHGAIQTLEKLIALNPANQQAFMKRGVVFRAAGEINRSIADFNRLIELNPSNEIAYNNRGLTYFKGDACEQAIMDYSTAIDLNAVYAEAWYNRAVAKNKIGDAEGAKADMRRAGELNPKFAVSSYVKRAGMSVYSKLVTDYSKAISENPNNQSPYLARAIAYRKLGNIQGAIQDCETAIKLNDRDSECYLVRGEVQFYAQNYDEAVNDFTKSLSLRHDAITMYFRSMAKRRKGDYQGAISDQAKALEMRPRLADDYINRGYAKSNTGDFLGAVEDFEMARDIFREKQDEKRQNDMDELIKKTSRRR